MNKLNETLKKKSLQLSTKMILAKDLPCTVAAVAINQTIEITQLEQNRFKKIKSVDKKINALF